MTSVLKIVVDLIYTSILQKAFYKISTLSSMKKLIHNLKWWTSLFMDTCTLFYLIENESLFKEASSHCKSL